MPNPIFPGATRRDRTGWTGGHAIPMSDGGSRSEILGSELAAALNDHSPPVPNARLDPVVAALAAQFAPADLPLPESLPGALFEWRLDEGTGLRFLNSFRRPFDPGASVVNFGEQALVGVTTPNYATAPNGRLTADRLTTTNWGVVTYYIPPGTWTYGIWVKSATGANQSIKLRRIEGGYVPEGAFTATAEWKWAWATFTNAADVSNLGIFSNEGGGATPVDLLVWGLVCVPGSVNLTHVPPQWDGGLQLDGTAPSWSPEGLVFATSQGCKAYTEAGGTALTRATVYAVAKKTGAFPTADEGGLLTFGGMSLNIVPSGTDSLTGHRLAGSFGAATTVADMAAVDDGAYHFLVLIYDATTLSLYYDGYLVATDASHAGQSASSAYALLGALTAPNFSWAGTIAHVDLYSRAHTAAQVRQMTVSLRARVTAKGLTLPVQKFWLVEGDSRTAGFAVLGGQAYRYAAQLALTTYRPAYSAAVSGSFAGRYSGQADAGNLDASQRVAGNLARIDPNGSTIVTLWFGANDVLYLVQNGRTPAQAAAEFLAKLQALAAAYRGQPGVSAVLVATDMNRTDQGSTDNANFAAARAIYNPAIRAGAGVWHDGTIDLASDATMGGNAAPDNATYFGDKLHPTAAGHALLAPYFTDAVDGVS
jgi:lysophospholipase L1-like esterase